LVSDLFAYCRTELPRWNTISISGYHMAEAGATPVQEVAFTLANAKAYVRAAQAAGLHVDDFAPRLSFFFVARTTMLEEVAKFRAARRIWAHIMRDEFGAQNPKSQMLRFHTQTAGVQLTASRRWLPYLAAISRCIRTPTTRLSACRQPPPLGWLCGRSRCSRTRLT
jgi:methylmalonyl-CoA mutase N-terminal domain/subunit